MPSLPCHFQAIPKPSKKPLNNHFQGYRLGQFALLILLFCSFAVSANTKLPAPVLKQLERFKIPRDALSVVVQDLSNDKIKLIHRPDVARNPASTIKLLTTMAGLDILGPSYTWRTRYYTTGKIKNGVLNGDLYLQGSGDPALIVEKLWIHVSALQQRGIKSITGQLILDNSAFQLPIHDRAAFDKQPNRVYNIGPGATAVNYSATRFVLLPNEQGKIHVFADPPLHNLVIENNIKATKGQCQNRNSGWSYKTRLQGDKIIATFNGKYRTSCGEHGLLRTVLDNDRYTWHLFNTLWQQHGGTIQGGFRIGVTPEDAKHIVDVPSPPLADAITSINKYSNNQMARQLLLSIAAASGDKPATIEAGRAAIYRWLQSITIAPERVLIDNGSGLSRRSKMSTRTMATLLRYAWISPLRPEFLSSLSIVARDGTMRKRLRKGDYGARLRFKTGYLRGNRTLAGYVHSRNNRRYSVALFLNHKRVNFSNGNAIQDALIKWLYEQ